MILLLDNIKPITKKPVAGIPTVNSIRDQIIQNKLSDKPDEIIEIIQNEIDAKLALETQDRYTVDHYDYMLGRQDAFRILRGLLT